MMHEFQIGYITNIHDSTNVDIGMEFISGDLDIIQDKYKYQDITESGKTDVKIGRTYRCRLMGLGVRQEVRKTKRYKSSQLDLERIISRCGGFLCCRLYAVDRYKRILVTLYDPISKQNINELLLSRYDDVFYEYKVRNRNYRG